MNTTLTSVPYDTFTYTNTTAAQNSLQISNNSAVNHNIVFHGPNGKEVGRMDFNSGELVFEGNAHMSADVFIEWCRKTWADLRVKDKTDTLRAVIANIIEESSGELYSEEEKVAMLTCIQRVQEMLNHLNPQLDIDYAQGQAPLTPLGLQSQVLSASALAPEGTV